MSRYTDTELATMAKTALLARQQNDMRWLMLAGVLTTMFNISEAELIAKLEEFAGKEV